MMMTLGVSNSDMDVIEKIKDVNFKILFLLLITTVVLLISDVNYYGLLCGYVFLALWSLDKVFLWYFNFDFGIHVHLTIKKDAHKLVRLLGLAFVVFVFYIAVKGLYQHILT